jgi:hypothetical protein
MNRFSFFILRRGSDSDNGHEGEDSTMPDHEPMD